MLQVPDSQCKNIQRVMPRPRFDEIPRDVIRFDDLSLLDRLLHHAHVVAIQSDSFRLREKRRAGVLIRTNKLSTEESG